MDAMREAWTDARLDDLNGRVGDLGRRMDNGFNQIHADIRALDAKVDSKIDGLDSKVDSKIDGLDSKIDGLDSKIDSKIGGLDAKVDSKIDGLDSKIDGLDSKVDSKVDGLRAESRAEFAAVRGEIASLHRLLIQGGGGIIGTMIVGFLGLIATRF
jgi:outer membrane murein-binding lipoprotein Lpp